MAGLRKIIAQRMVESLRVAAQLTTVVEVDLTAIAELRSRVKSDFEAREGVYVPVIRNAGELSIAELSRQIADVAARTRDNKIKPEELAGGTFTITNTGSRGALFDTPIINQPQVAILGTGAVVRRPATVRGEDGKEDIVNRSMAYLALSYDHRLVDGADAARFLSTIKGRLERGDFTDEVGA
jgi:2-oxoglutarate dehydrogenase E2 component (dihydrolipoamide succinyltransferase)